MYIKFFTISIILAIAAYYFNKSRILYFVNKFYKSAPQKSSPSLRLLTSDELNLYNGIDKPELYLSVLGRVYDVTKGSTHYGPGKPYNVFVGRDRSRSFVSGDFNEKSASDEVADFTQEELRSLDHWVKFYKKEYSRIGKLIGKYFDDSGKLTPYGKIVKQLIKLADEAKENENLEKLKFPPCNIEWDAHRGTHVWCTKKSGGIARDWTGVPRQFYEPGSQNFRCACIHKDAENMANLKQYEGCDSESESCFVKNS